MHLFKWIQKFIKSKNKINFMCKKVTNILEKFSYRKIIKIFQKYKLAFKSIFVTKIHI